MDNPLLIHHHGAVNVGPAIVQAADSIKLQNYKTNTPKTFQVQPLHTEDASTLMQELADRIKVPVERLDFVYFSVCRGAEEHTDLLDPAVFESRTFVIPVILPQGDTLIVAKDVAGADGIVPTHATFVKLNHIYEFDHEKPHSMHVQDTESGCVVIMVAIKKDKEPLMIEDFRNQLVTARKNKDPATIGILQMLISALQNKAIELGHDLTKDESIALLIKEQAKRVDAAQQFTAAGAMDKAAQETAEAAFINRFLPQQMSVEEVQAIIKEEVQKFPWEQKLDMGTLMKPVRARVGNLFPGKELSLLVKNAAEKTHHREPA